MAVAGRLVAYLVMDIGLKVLKHPNLLFFLQGHDKYEFSDPARIQGLVKNYSQFVSFPIYTWQEKSRTVEVRRLKLSSLSGRLFGRLKILDLCIVLFVQL